VGFRAEPLLNIGLLGRDRTDLMSWGAPVIQSAPVFALPVQAEPRRRLGHDAAIPIIVWRTDARTGSFFMD
jgi:hypothetical protein